MFIMLNMHVHACMYMSAWGAPPHQQKPLPQSTHPHPPRGPLESVKIQ